MELLGWIASILSIVGIVFNAKKHILCWPIWLVSNVLWIIYFINIWNPQSLLLWIVFFGFNIYGWIQWKKDKKPKTKKHGTDWVNNETFGPHKNRRGI
jgi:nicotinamide riboside transporter PnuC